MATISNWYLQAIGIKHRVKITTQSLAAHPYRVRVHFTLRPRSSVPNKTQTLEMSVEDTRQLISELENELKGLNVLI